MSFIRDVITAFYNVNTSETLIIIVKIRTNCLGIEEKQLNKKQSQNIPYLDNRNQRHASAAPSRSRRGPRKQLRATAFYRLSSCSLSICQLLRELHTPRCDCVPPPGARDSFLTETVDFQVQFVNWKAIKVRFLYPVGRERSTFRHQLLNVVQVAFSGGQQ